MSRKNKHKPELFRNGTLTPEALKAYAAGELDAAGRAELERYFQDDPFAAEAADGLQEVPQTDFLNEVGRLNQQIRNEAGSPANAAGISSWTRWLAAAAMLILLMVFGYLVPRFMGKEEAKIALRDQEEVSENPEPQPATSATMEESKPSHSDAREVTPATVPSPPEISPPAAGVAVVTTTEESRSKPLNAKEKSVTDEKETIVITEAVASPETDVALAETTVQEQPASRQESSRALKKEAMTASAKADSERSSSSSPKEAMKLFEDKQYAAAAVAFDAVVKENPSAQEAVYYSGLSHYINDNYTKALTRFESLIGQNRKYRNGSLYYKSLILIKQGKKQEALPLLEELRKNPGSFQKKAEELLREP